MGEDMAGYVHRLTLMEAHPRLIDEWQEVPALWDAVRATVDDLQQRGAFVLTGSAVPPRVDEDDEKCEIRHTGTGRIARLTMQTGTSPTGMTLAF